MSIYIIRLESVGLSKVISPTRFLSVVSPRKFVFTKMLRDILEAVLNPNLYFGIYVIHIT